MRRSNVALRLQPSLLEEARNVAASEGIALNQLINVAVAEKLSVLRTDEYFRQMATGASVNLPQVWIMPKEKANRRGAPIRREAGLLARLSLCVDAEPAPDRDQRQQLPLLPPPPKPPLKPP